MKIKSILSVLGNLFAGAAPVGAFKPVPLAALDKSITREHKGNIRGDKFYKALSYKRVNGKWRVKI